MRERAPLKPFPSTSRAKYRLTKTLLIAASARINGRVSTQRVYRRFPIIAGGRLPFGAAVLRPDKTGTRTGFKSHLARSPLAVFFCGPLALIAERQNAS